MVGHRRRRRGDVLEARLARALGTVDRGDLLLADEAVEQLRVVQHLVLAAELRVLVLDRVEAVRAGDDDLRRADLVEGLDVLLREHLEEHLVARAASGVTGAGLAVAEDGEVHAGVVEELGDGSRRLLGAVLVGAGAADPEEVVDLVGGLDVLPEHLDGEGEVLRPVHARLGAHAPGVALGLELLEETTELAREGRLDEVLVAAHVDDVVDVLDVHRALLDAGAAGGAGPQDVLVDDGVGAVRVVGRQRVVGVVAGLADEGHLAPVDRVGLGGGDGALGLRRLRPVGEGHHTGGRLGAGVAGGGDRPGDVVSRGEVRRLGVRVVAQRHDHHLGGEGLLGVPRGALALAATALGAGGEVEEALPGEVLDRAHAEGGVLVHLLHDLHGEGLAVDEHRLQLAERGAPVRVPLEVDVEEGEEAVPGHTHRRGEGDGDHPRVGDEQLDQRHDDDRVLQRAHGHALEERAQPRGEREVQERGVLGVARVGEQRVLETAEEGDADADAEDRELDVVGLPEGRAEEAGLAAVLARGGPRVVLLPDRHEHDDRDDARHREELGDPLVEEEGADEGQHEVRVEELERRLHQRQEEHPEGDHRDPVGDRDHGETRHPRVTEELAQQRGRAGTRLARSLAFGSRLAELEEGDEVLDDSGEQTPSDDGDPDAEDDRDDLEGRHEGDSRSLRASRNPVVMRYSSPRQA